jgi:hypothetical protein
LNQTKRVERGKKVIRRERGPKSGASEQKKGNSKREAANDGMSTERSGRRNTKCLESY